jgi:hypothetical protein
MPERGGKRPFRSRRWVAASRRDRLFARPGQRLRSGHAVWRVDVETGRNQPKRQGPLSRIARPKAVRPLPANFGHSTWRNGEAEKVLMDVRSLCPLCGRRSGSEYDVLAARLLKPLSWEGRALLGGARVTVRSHVPPNETTLPRTESLPFATRFSSSARLEVARWPSPSLTRLSAPPTVMPRSAVIMRKLRAVLLLRRPSGGDHQGDARGPGRRRRLRR